LQTQKLELAFTQKSGHFLSHMGKFSHLDDVFYFQDANEDNGTHVPFTIGIQTPFQLQAMVSVDDNGAISWMPPLAPMM